MSVTSVVDGDGGTAQVLTRVAIGAKTLFEQDQDHITYPIEVRVVGVCAYLNLHLTTRGPTKGKYILFVCII